jgi:DNA topoisomerase I
MPGKELFQYYDENKERKSIDSGMVNEYIKRISGGDFTTKDFRTWTGTVNAISVLHELGCCETETASKKNIVDALDEVARRLGNTRTVCKKYYVHPRILELYSSNELDKFFKNNNNGNNKLLEEEEVLMKIIG